jgi:hypothetical protein
MQALTGQLLQGQLELQAQVQNYITSQIAIQSELLNVGLMDLGCIAECDRANYDEITRTYLCVVMCIVRIPTGCGAVEPPLPPAAAGAGA